MKLIITVLIALLLLPSVFAVTVTTSPTNSDPGGLVTITARGCAGMTFIRIISPGSTLIDARQGLSPLVITYNTASDPSVGTYQAKASCAGVTGEATTNFCVGTSCATAPVETSTSSSSGSSGGGRRCTPSWSCEPWSYCNATLQQSRTCHDANKCQTSRVEVQECAECKESWVCGLWSECQAGNNFRSCIDEYGCGTTTLKPWLTKTCVVVDSGPPPRTINQQMPPPYVEPEIQQPQPTVSFYKNSWNNYKEFIIAIPAVLILIILIVVLIVHFIPKGKMVYNLDELKDWIKKEQAMGTSNEDIKQLLSQHTGWQEQEIDEAFMELQQNDQ